MSAPRTRDEWLMDFVLVLIDAGRPRKLAYQIAHAEWASRSADDPSKAAREWIKKQGKPESKKP